MKSTNFFNFMDYVYAVYQEGSFTRAAEKLYISQPALSLTIKKVEKEIGAPIFERSGREIKPTVIGAKYIAAIESTMRIQNNLNTEIDDILMLKNGTISIGAPQFIAENILPEPIRLFKSRYPDIEVRVFAESDSMLESRLDNNEVDLVINNAAVFMEGYKYHTLVDERIFIVASKEIAQKHGIAKKAITVEQIRNSPKEFYEDCKVSVVDLQSEKFILLNKGSKLRQMGKHIFDERKLIPNVAMEFEQESTAVKYAEAGFGICFISEKQIKYGNFNADVSLFLPATNYAAFSLYAIRKKSRYISDTVKEFTELLHSHLKKQFYD
ncbi:MAG: LysR family transcriptional regulator [Clostridia bacterium]|nr:LysR family transcriptional regulator [Clostridia bacterium]